jgi:hypothetical protein
MKSHDRFPADLTGAGNMATRRHCIKGGYLSVRGSFTKLAILHLKCNIAHHENALSDTVTGACA